MPDTRSGRPADRGREAYADHAWEDAYQALTQASAESPLEADDVERLAIAAGLSGHEQRAVEAFGRLHELRLGEGDKLRASRAALWAAMRLLSMGERAQGAGWLARAQRLVEDEPAECVEHGWLRLPLFFRLTAAGDHVAAAAAAAEAVRIGDDAGDADLGALGRSFQGRALIRLGRFDEGLALIDEAMVDVARGELSPLVTGLVYCDAIAGCHQCYAIGRAREWTEALRWWCDDQPQLVPFAGACHVHRSQVLLLAGEWPEALDEARRASDRLAGTLDSRRGHARYQEAELHRLRGELDLAEGAYALASELGRDPQPGMALLRLAQGRVDLAAAAMRRVLAETHDPIQRARLLPAHVEVMLAAGELAEARRSANELLSIAEEYRVEMLRGMAMHAHGAVLLAEGDAPAAIEPLREAQALWQRVGAPYLSARIRAVIARACRELGDKDGERLELDAALKVFREVGAGLDIAAAGELTPPDAADSRGLTRRELDVLRLVATGKTNREIARDLYLSPKTVDRHVSNLFGKLGLKTRAAATAWAHRRGVVG